MSFSIHNLFRSNCSILRSNNSYLVYTQVICLQSNIVLYSWSCTFRTCVLLKKHMVNNWDTGRDTICYPKGFYFLQCIFIMIKLHVITDSGCQSVLLCTVYAAVLNHHRHIKQKQKKKQFHKYTRRL